MERGVPAPTNVKGLVSATTQLNRDAKEMSARQKELSAFLDETLEALKARELDDDAFLARLEKLNDLNSDITSQYAEILPTYYKLKEVVNEAQALHSTIAPVRDPAQPQQRNHLPTLIVVVACLLILLSCFIICVV
jgi:predicted transcriptional regulator